MLAHTQPKRPRGRPRIDDAKEIAQVADLIAIQSLKPMTAIKRVARGNDAMVHRLYMKWKRGGDGPLVAAKERLRQRQAEQFVANAAHVMQTLRSVAEDMARRFGPDMQRAIEGWKKLEMQIANDPGWMAAQQQFAKLQAFFANLEADPKLQEVRTQLANFRFDPAAVKAISEFSKIRSAPLQLPQTFLRTE